MLTWTRQDETALDLLGVPLAETYEITVDDTTLRWTETTTLAGRHRVRTIPTAEIRAITVEEHGWWGELAVVVVDRRGRRHAIAWADTNDIASRIARRLGLTPR